MTGVSDVQNVRAPDSARERGVRHLVVLLAGAGSDADAADDVAVDDDRQAARQVDALAVRGDGELEVDAGRDIAGRDAIGGGGHRLHQRRIDGLREGAVHAGERQQVAAAVDDGNALRHAHLLRLRHRGIEQLHCAVRCQLQRRQRICHDSPLCTSDLLNMIAGDLLIALEDRPQLVLADDVFELVEALVRRSAAPPCRR